MKLFQLLRWVLLLSLASSFSSRLAAESKTETAPPERARLISLDFPGGSLSKFIEMVTENRAVSFNIIGAGNPADFAVVLPPFSLRNAELHAVANVLTSLLEPRFFSLRIAGATPDSITCVLTPIFRVTETAPKASNEFASFQLAPYLGAQSVDEIVAAIRAAWELDPANTPELLRVKFHPGTAILLVSAPPQGISMARDIIVNLRHSPENPRANAPASENKK